MNITMNDRLEFAHDENNPKEWFLHKTADKQGFPLQFNRGGTRLRNKYIYYTKLLQKREMRKDIVIELSYKGFSRASDYS